MSSLAAAQADGYYIPTEYLESGAYKKKSLNQYNNSKGHNQYLQRSVCRFELPFDGFCTQCDAIVGKGTRFNAHKAHVDDYFTTKIYEFTTKCRACGKCVFKIRTNPKERTFDYTSGIRKKVEEFDSAEAGTHGVIDTDIGNGIHEFKNGIIDVSDITILNKNEGAAALNLLEKNVTGDRKAQTEHQHMTSLIQLNSKMAEDADANAILRATFRKDRKAKKRRLGEAAKKGLGRGIELSGEMAEDATLAKQMMDMRKESRDRDRARQSEKDKFTSIRAGSIFTLQQKSPKHSLSRSTKMLNKTQWHRKNSVDIKKTSPKQKNPIFTPNLKRNKMNPVKNTTTNSSPGDNVLAALSSCYASDSD